MISDKRRIEVLQEANSYLRHNQRDLGWELVIFVLGVIAGMGFVMLHGIL